MPMPSIKRICGMWDCTSCTSKIAPEDCRFYDKSYCRLHEWKMECKRFDEMLKKLKGKSKNIKEGNDGQ